MPSWVASILLPALGFGLLVGALLTFVPYKRAERGLAGGLCGAAIAGSIAAWRSIPEVESWVKDHPEIPLTALVVGAIAALAVAFLEAKRDKERNLFQSIWKEPLKPLIAGICTAALAGFSYAELDDSEVGRWADQHSIFTSTLTGVLLLGITVLVIDAVVRLVASQPWEESLEDTWALVVRQARRGFFDIYPHLVHGGSPVTVDSLPPREESEAAYDAAREVSIELGHSVGRASLAAFASDQPELGHSMNRLSSAADRLQRVLFRYWRGDLTHQEVQRNRGHVVKRWQAYVCCLCEVDRLGRGHGFKSPADDARARLENELKEARAKRILDERLGSYDCQATYEDLIDTFTFSSGSKLIARIETPGRVEYRVGSPGHFVDRAEAGRGPLDIFLLSHDAEGLGAGAMWCNPRLAFAFTRQEPPTLERFSGGLRVSAPGERTITVAVCGSDDLTRIEQIEIEDEDDRDE